MGGGGGNSLGLTVDSPGLNGIHLDSLEFNWTHLDSHGFTWTHLVSLGFIWARLNSQFSNFKWALHVGWSSAPGGPYWPPSP